MFGFGKKTQETSLQTSGMSCGHCEMRVTKALKEIKGVKSVTASASSGTVIVKHEEGVDPNALKTAIVEAGYTVKD